LARIKLGLQDCLYLGNLDARRDWGHARDYVEAQWLMLQQENPEDFVIATGNQHSVRDFVNIAANQLGLSIVWEGYGLDEVGVLINPSQGKLSGVHKSKIVIRIDPRYFRPSEVESLLGDATRAREKLGWLPRVSFTDLVSEMVMQDFKEAEKDELIKQYGYNAFNHNE
jgi:GDPmannose 4,6-dehydratase